MAGAAPASAHSPLDPFRPKVPATRPSPTQLNPFRAQAPAAASQTATSPAGSALAAPSEKRCTSDEACPLETVCDDGVCHAFDRPVHVLLFRKDGPSTAFIPFYWSRRGTPGHTVVAPFYFHYWSALAHDQVVAPFYWHFEDHLKARVVTVVWAGLPVSWTREPGAHSVAVWPLFYKSSQFGWAAPLLASFALSNPETGRAFGLFGLLYYWHRNRHEGTAFDLLPPLFVSSRTREHAFTWTLPLNFYWRTGEDTRLVIPPLAFASWNAKESTTATLIGYSSHSGRNHTGAFGWLYWYGRQPSIDSDYDVIFPLIWNFRSLTSDSTVVFPYLHFRRSGSEWWTLFPLALSSEDTKKGTSFALVLPFAFWTTRDHGASNFWLTPLGGGGRDRDAGSHTLAWLVPPLFYRTTPKSSFQMLLGLFWHNRDDNAGSNTYVVGPFVSNVDREGSTRALVPVWWSAHDRVNDGEAQALLPFYVHRRNPDESTTALGVFPLMGYHRRFSDGGSSGGLFPLAFFGQRHGRSHAVLFPLFFRFASPDRSTTALLPLFYHHHEPGRSATVVPPLLLFGGHDQSAAYQVQFPLFWHFADAATGRSTTVVPPVFWHREANGWSAGVAPLLFAGASQSRSHLIVAPLFWHFTDQSRQQSTTVVATFWHRRRGGETTDAVFPLFHYRRGTPPGGTEGTSLTLLPIFHYRRDAGGSAFLSPLIGWHNTDQHRVGFVGPYFWYRDQNLQARVLFPLYADVAHPQTGERTRMFGPFFSIDGPDGERSQALFPLWLHYQDAHETGTYVFPTFFHLRRQAGYAVDTLFPFFWRSRGPRHSTWVVGPWFSRHEDTAAGPNTVNGVFPLFVSARNSVRTWFLAPLVFAHENLTQGTSQLSAGLLFYRATAPGGSRTMIFPLWSSGHEGNRSHAVLFPLFWHFANQDLQTSVTVLGPFFSRSVRTSTTRGLAPVVWHSHDTASGASTNALLPLFYERHGGNASTLLTPLFGFGSAALNASRWWYAGPLVHHASVDSETTALVPLWINHFNRETETTTSALLPLLHFARSNPERGFSVWLALLWHRRSIDSASSFFVPLFFDSHSYHLSRTTVLFPLFLRHHNEPEDTTYTVAPLFYRRATPADSTTVLFPLLWDFRSAERSTTLVLPFYVGVKRASYAAHYVFPNIYWSHGRGPDEGTSHLVVFPFWETAVRRPGDFMWEALFGMVGYERVGRNRFMKLFFVPFELKPAPAAQTAWYGRDTRRAARRPERDLRAAAW